MSKLQPLKKQTVHKNLNLKISVFLFFFAFVLYFNTLNHGYLLDDHTVLSANKYTQQGIKAIPTLLTTAYWYGYDGSTSSVYRPLSTIIFAVEHEFFGLNPKASHFINVLLYALTGIVLFITLSKLFRSNVNFNPVSKTIFSFIVAVIYIAHPVHTEVVANVKSRDEILCFFFVILSVFFLLKYNEYEKKNIFNIILSMICFFFSLLSKETSFAFVLILPIILYYFSNIKFSENIKLTGFLVLTGGVYLIMRINFLDKSFSGDFSNNLMTNSLVGAETYYDRLGTAIFILMKYIWLLILPHPLVYDYSYNQIPNLKWYDVKAIFSVLLLMTLIGYSIYKFKIKDLFSFSIFYFFISFFVVSNIAVIIGAPMAERFIYLPSFAYCIAFGWILVKIFKIKIIQNAFIVKENWKLVSALVIILTAYGFKTISRNQAWENNLTLFVTDIEHASNSARAQLFLGIESLKYPDRYQQGVEAMKKAVRINPSYRDAHYNLGVGYEKLNMLDSASYCFLNAIAIDSMHLKSYSNAGGTLGKIGKYDEAIYYLTKAIKMAPNFFDAYVNLGSVYGKKGDLDNAINTFTKAIELKPKNPRPYDNLGIIYAQKKDYENAIKYFNKSIALDPKLANAYLNLGITYQTIGNTELANLNYSKAFELDPNLKR